MADQAFESRLQRLFAEAPTFPDDRAFAQRIEARLDRGWAVRRIAILAAGLGGGLIAMAQLVGSNFAAQLDSASRNSLQGLRDGAAQAVGRFGDLAPALRVLPMAGEAAWLIAGMAALAAALLATRLMEDL